MNYIRNRQNYKELFNESAPSEQLYDGTWEDTFIGRLFSFMGRKITTKVKKGKLDRLIRSLENVLIDSKLQTIQSNEKVQEYELYQHIAIIKSYLYNEKFDQDEFLILLEEAIYFHEQRSQTEEFKIREDIIEKHAEFKEKFEELKEFTLKINESLIYESIDTDLLPIESLNETLIKYINIPLVSGKTDTIMTVNIGTETRYNELKNPLFEFVNKLRKELSQYLNEDLSSVAINHRIKDLYEYMGSAGTQQRGQMNWDNVQQLRVNIKYIQDKLKEILDLISEELDFIELMGTMGTTITKDPNASNVSEILDKANSLFPDDNLYKDKLALSRSELKSLLEDLREKVEEQKKYVDPIAILRIFNRAYNNYSITKDEYDLFEKRYSKRTAARKAREYEVLGNSARHKQLFREWNDNVLEMLQLYGELIDKNTKEFIISLLDDNKLFGNMGEQYKLLAKHYDIKYDKKAFTDSLKSKDSKKIKRGTDTHNAEFDKITRLQFNEDVVDVPFIIDGTNTSDGSTIIVNIKPLEYIKKGDYNFFRVKYSVGTDYGFIKNYTKGTDFSLDTKTIEALGSKDSDKTFVFIGDFISNETYIEVGNTYQFRDIEKVADLTDEANFSVKIKSLYVLKGKDGKLKELPKPTKEIMDAVNDSPYDNFDVK